MRYPGLHRPMRFLHNTLTLAAVFALTLAACDDGTPPSPAPAPPSTPAAPAGGDADAGTGAGTGADAGTGTGTGTDAGTGTGAGAGARADAGADAGSARRDAGAPADAGAPVDAGATAQADAGAADAAAPGAGLPAPEAGSADAVAAEVDAIFTNIRAYSARFKQEHTQKVAGVVRKQSGTLVFERPAKISFRYDAPSKNRIVSDGVTLKVYVAEDEQMFVSPVEKSEYPGALAFLMGKGMRPSFTFTFNEKAKFEGGPVLVGKPRSPTPHYDLVMFYVDRALLAKKDPGTIRRVLVVDAQGNRNRFDFEQVKVPASVDPGEFQFTPPPGTAVKGN